MKPFATLRRLFLILPLLLVSCGSSKQASVDPAAIYTAAVKTAEAKMTQLAAITPTLPTIIPSATAVPRTPAPLVTDTPSGDTAPATGTPDLNVPATGDHAEFVEDVSVPDGTSILPGQSFSKTWRLINAGDTTWTSAYKLVYSSGTQMGQVTSVPMPVEVPPGKTVDISVDMFAPLTEGSYTAYWMLRTPSGKEFGVGPYAAKPIYVMISVSGSLPITPGASSGNVVASVSLSLDPTTWNATCPAQFTITPKINLLVPAELTYELEIGGDSSITPPDEETETYPAGVSRILPFHLEMTKDFEGWVVLHITEPEEITSNPVYFKAVCK